MKNKQNAHVKNAAQTNQYGILGLVGKSPAAVVAVAFIITVFMALSLRKIRMDNNSRQYFPQKHSSYKALIDSEDAFGSTAAVGISLETDKGLIVTPENLAIIDRITEGIAALPTVDDIQSITSIDYISGEDGGLVAGQLIDKDRGEDGYLPPLTDEDAAQVRHRLAEWDNMYSRVVVSDDGKAAQIAVTLKVNNHPNLVSAAGVQVPVVDALAAAGVVTVKDFRHAVKKGTKDGRQLEDIEGVSRNDIEKIASYAKRMPFDSDIWQKTLGEMHSIVDQWTADSSLKVVYFGDAVFSDNAKHYIMTDLISLVPLVAIVVIISLFVSFKTVDGTLLPLAAVLMASVWTCGLMALLGFTFTIISSVIPVALIACGSAYGIHVLTHYYIFLDDALEKKQPMTRELHRDIILRGLFDVRAAVFLAAVTTVVGFASLVGSPLGPLHSFAIFTALGIAFSYLLSVTFIPAVLMLKSPEKVGCRSRHMEKLAAKVKAKMESRQGAATSSDSSGYYKVFRSLCGTKYRLFAFIACLLLVGWSGIRRLHVDTNMINYFPKTSKFHRDVDYADSTFAGTKSIYLLVHGPVDEDGEPIPGSMNSPDILEALDGLQDELAAKFDGVGKCVSFTTFIKRMNQVMHVPQAVSVQSTLKGEGGATSQGAEDTTAGGDFGADDFWDFGDFDFGDDFGGDFNEAGDTSVIASETKQPASVIASDSEAISDDFSDFDFGDFDVEGGTPSLRGEAEATSSPTKIASQAAQEGSNRNDDGVAWVDPNETYSRILSMPMTVQDGIAMFAEAYAEAGGRGARVEDMVKAIERRINYNGTAYYEVPTDPDKYPVATREELKDLVGQYLLLYSGSLDDFANNPLTPTQLRVQVQLRKYSADYTGGITQAVNHYVAAHFPEGYTVELTGSAELECLMADMVVTSQAQSLIGSLLCVFLIIGVSFRRKGSLISPLAGLVGALPLALTIALNYMVMGFFHIDLDLITSIIASVAVGVGIDYTIHFMETYRAKRATTTRVSDAAQETFKTSGVGIVTNALAVGLGFLVLYMSRFVVLRYVGILVAIVMFTSSTLAMTVIPGILVNFDPKFTRPEEEDA